MLSEEEACKIVETRNSEQTVKDAIDLFRNVLPKHIQDAVMAGLMPKPEPKASNRPRPVGKPTSQAAPSHPTAPKREQSVQNVYHHTPRFTAPSTNDNDFRAWRAARGK